MLILNSKIMDNQDNNNKWDGDNYDNINQYKLTYKI